MAGGEDPGGSGRLSRADDAAEVSRGLHPVGDDELGRRAFVDLRDVAVRLVENFPTVFWNLTNKILSLTGQGAELGKPKPSGKTRKSTPP